MKQTHEAWTGSDGHVTAAMHCPVGMDIQGGLDVIMSVISPLLLQLLIYGFRMSPGIRY